MPPFWDRPMMLLSLAEAISVPNNGFVPLMNEKGRSIGAEDTKFINATVSG